MPARTCLCWHVTAADLHACLLRVQVKEIASHLGCTPGQLALAWVHHQVLLMAWPERLPQSL
jgi:hypothetical protein